MANFPQSPQNTPVFVSNRSGGMYMHRAWVLFFQSLGSYFGEFQPIVDNPTANNFASLNATGEIQDSGFDGGSFARKQHTHQDDSQGGKIDHGLGLSGLTDDDHPQYLNINGRAAPQVVAGDVLFLGAVNVAGGYRVETSTGQTTIISLASTSRIRVNGGIITEVI